MIAADEEADEAEKHWSVAAPLFGVLIERLLMTFSDLHWVRAKGAHLVVAGVLDAGLTIRSRVLAGQQCGGRDHA